MSSLGQPVCLHCKASVPPNEAYCCTGCAAAHALLKDEDLTSYYALTPDVVAPAPTLASGADALAALQIDIEAGRSVTFYLRGLHCAGCVWVVQALFEREPGALAMDLNPSTGKVTLQAETAFDLVAYGQKLQALGYFAQAAPAAAPSQTDGLLLRTGVLWALALNAMMLGFAGYFGLDAATEPLLATVFGSLSIVLGVLSLVVAFPVFARPALTALVQGLVSLDLPIVFGMLAVTAASALAVAQSGFAASYFDTLAVFNALMVSGRFLQARLVEQNQRALRDGGDLAQMRVRRLASDETIAFVTAADVLVGDRLLLVPGETLLCTAQVSTSGLWNFASLTGEAAPRHVEAGAMLPAGVAYAGQDGAHVTVEEPPHGASLTEALTTVTWPAQRRGGARWWPVAYVGAVVLAAGAAAWLWRDAPWPVLSQIVAAVFVVTCPCAFGIAGPLAISRGIALLRRDGLFIKAPDLFFRLAQVRDIFLDKTGTITQSVPHWSNVSAFEWLPGDAQRAVAQMCARSLHPLSVGIHTALNQRAPVRWRADVQVEERIGVGLFARVDDVAWSLRSHEGTLTLLRDGGAGDTPVFRFEFADRTEDGAREEIAQLHAAGYRVHILSGDDPERTQAVAARVGVPPARAHGGLTPADKADHVAQHGAQALMVGDGLNDVAAMQAAQCAGTPRQTALFVPRAADFFFVRNGFVPLAALLNGARRVRHARVFVFTLAAVYNLCVLALALHGDMRPVVCAVLMPASSVTFIALTVVLTGNGRAAHAAGSGRLFGLAPFLRGKRVNAAAVNPVAPALARDGHTV